MRTNGPSVPARFRAPWTTWRTSSFTLRKIGWKRSNGSPTSPSVSEPRTAHAGSVRAGLVTHLRLYFTREWLRTGREKYLLAEAARQQEIQARQQAEAELERLRQELALLRQRAPKDQSS